MIDEFIAALHQLHRERVRTVVLRANPGAKVSSAGHDFRELPTKGSDFLAYEDPLERMIRAVTHFSAPAIAMIDGRSASWCWTWTS